MLHRQVVERGYVPQVHQAEPEHQPDPGAGERSERALHRREPPGGGAHDHPREGEQQEQRGDVAEQHVLHHVGGEEVLLPEVVQGRDECGQQGEHRARERGRLQRARAAAARLAPRLPEAPHVDARQQCERGEHGRVGEPVELRVVRSEVARHARDCVSGRPDCGPGIGPARAPRAAARLPQMAHVAVIHERVGGAGGFGSARLVTQLARGLDRIGHRVTLCCYDQGPSVFDEETSQVEVRSVLPYLGQDGTPRSTLARYWRGMARLAANVPDDVDVINAHEWMGLRAGVLAAHRTGAPLVWTRSDETFWEQALMPTEGRFAQRSPAMRAARGLHGVSDLVHARLADAIVVTSAHDGDMVRRKYRGRRT